MPESRNCLQRFAETPQICNAKKKPKAVHEIQSDVHFYIYVNQNIVWINTHNCRNFRIHLVAIPIRHFRKVRKLV